MIIIRFLILHIACLLSAIIPHAYASQRQHESLDATTTHHDDIAAVSSSQSSQKIMITPIRTQDDLKNFVNHGGLPLRNTHHPLEGNDDDSAIESSSDFNNEEEALFVLFDTPAFDPPSSDDVTNAKANAQAKAVNIKQVFESFAEKFYRDRGDEPLRFGIIETDIEIDGGEFTSDVFGKVIAEELGIGLGLGVGSSAPPGTVVCLRCGGIEGRVETWAVPESQSQSQSEEIGSRGVDEVEEVKRQLEKWMEKMARPVIRELTKGNYERVREMENTLPTVYVFARSRQQRNDIRRHTLSALATKYHSSLQIVVVDPTVFPNLMKELGLSLDSKSEGSGEGGVTGAVVWPQKKSAGDSGSDKVQKTIYHYPQDKPITESNVKQWGLDLYLGRIRPWVPPSSSNPDEGKEGQGGSGREEVLRDLKNRVRVVKGGKKATRKVTKRTGSGAGSIPGVKIRVAGRDEL